VRLLHELSKIHARFDDPHLVSEAGLIPVMALAQRTGLGDLAGEHVRMARPCGVNAPVKTGCLVAGMIAGADSIDDMGLLRHGAMGVLFGGVRAPSTLGRSCARLPGEMCCNCRRCTGSSWLGWPPGPRCCPARTCWRSWTSIRSRSGSTGTPSRAPGSATPKFRAKPCWSAA
jgi:hypothetical protein